MPIGQGTLKTQDVMIVNSFNR